MANSLAINAASRDNDLRERAIALAAQLGAPNPQMLVESNLSRIAAAPVGDGDATVASVYEYANTIYQAELSKLQRPGLNLSAVTDPHLIHALKSVFPELAE